jgi:hypothetical protein
MEIAYIHTFGTAKDDGFGDRISFLSGEPSEMASFSSGQGLLYETY